MKKEKQFEKQRKLAQKTGQVRLNFLQSLNIKMFSQIIWGLVILSGFIFNFQKVVELGFNWLSAFVLILGIAFIVWGIFGFRREIKQVESLK